jgi:hypothetical protein
MANKYYLVSFINLPFLKMVPNGSTQGCFCPIQLNHNIFSQLQLTHTLDNTYDNWKTKFYLPFVIECESNMVDMNSLLIHLFIQNAQ